MDGVSFSMQHEDVVTLLGRNSKGKPTLVHMIMGMLRPIRGSVRFRVVAIHGSGRNKAEYRLLARGVPW